MLMNINQLAIGLTAGRSDGSALRVIGGSNVIPRHVYKMYKIGQPKVRSLLVMCTKRIFDKNVGYSDQFSSALTIISRVNCTGREL